jgi:hypothetical protein
MMRDLASCDWNEKLQGQTAEQAWSTPTDHMHELVSKHVTERRRRNHNRPPSLNRDILQAIRRKKRLWKAAKAGQQVGEYKMAEKQVKNMIRNVKQSFEHGTAKSKWF